MRTTPHLRDDLNAAGKYEITWLVKTPAGWRSHVRSARTGDKAEAEIVLARFLSDRGEHVIPNPLRFKW